MIGDIWTDSGFLTGIGGCPTQNLAAQFASTTRTYFYQFDDLHAPGLNNDHPGYQWGAGPIRRRPRRVAATCLPPAPSRAGAAIIAEDCSNTEYVRAICVAILRDKNILRVSAAGTA